MCDVAFGQEEPFALPTQDGKEIYGFMNRASHNPLRRVVILSHGMLGDPFEHQFMLARRMMNARGFDVVRFAYYAPGKNARRLTECSLTHHAQDLRTVCDAFRGKYDRMYLAGHSFGGLVILHANATADLGAAAISFWDSSFTPYRGFLKHQGYPLEGTPYYTMNWGVNVLIGPEMVDEIKNLSEADSVAMAESIRCPSQVVLAEGSVDNPNRYGLYTALTCRKTAVEIPFADHRFTRGKTADQLIDETMRWFDEHGG